MADSEHHKLEIVERGDLEDITTRDATRPALGLGSRAMLERAQKQAGHRMPLLRETSLELLHPEEVVEMDYVHPKEDELSDSDGEVYLETGRTSSIFHIAEPLSGRGRQPNGMQLEDCSVADSADNEYRLTRQFSNAGSSGDIESDEERELMREIRREIAGRVREEMEDVLTSMGQRRTAAAEEAASIAAAKTGAGQLDEKLKAAIVKMHRLDRILNKKIDEEKRVKRERWLLQKRLREELEELREEGTKERRDEAINTRKFLALTLPPKHSEDNAEGTLMIAWIDDTDIQGDVFGIEEVRQSPLLTPVFHQTQVVGHNSGVTGSTHRSHVQSADEASTNTTEQLNESVRAASSNDSRSTIHEKDFIRRNIQLASDANNMIAMTDDEKQRVQELLSDIETMPDAIEQDADQPYQIVLSSGEGYRPTATQLHSLEAIDTRLKAILPAEDYESVASTNRSTVEQHSVLFTRTHLCCDVEEPGELALRQAKQQRDLQRRLDDIEHELQLLSFMELEPSTPSLSGAELDDLLDTCARTMSQATNDTQSMTDVSECSAYSRASLLENPPHLPDEVLQRLLSEATPSHSSEVSHRSEVTSSLSSGVTSSQSSEVNRSCSQSVDTVAEESVDETLYRPQRPSSALSGAAPLTPSQRARRVVTPSERRRQPFLPDLDPRGTPLSSGCGVTPLSSSCGMRSVSRTHSSESFGDRSLDSRSTLHTPTTDSRW